MLHKTFVITGASKGIGLAATELAARRGAKVVIADVDDAAGETAADHLGDAGLDVTYVHCDITDPFEVEDLMRYAAELHGGIDVLVNNAGIHEGVLTSDFAFEELPVDVFDRVLEVNLRGTFLCSQKATPFLRQSKRNPTIINAGSTASIAGFPYCLAYGTSKGGIALMTKNLAVALAPHGIRVNCYCPSSVDTKILRDVSTAIDTLDPRATDSRPLNASQLGGHLVGRIGQPYDIAELICFLAGDQSTFVNGAVWLIDGGVMAWRDSLEDIGM